MSLPSSKAINFPAWVPQDARVALTTLYDATQDYECRSMLHRIATRYSMEEVWARPLEELCPSILVTWTYLMWLSATNIRPVHKSISKSSRSKSTPVRESAAEPSPFEIASQARAVASAVKAFHPKILAANKISEVTQQELDRVARFFERQTDDIRFWVKFAPPPRKVRARNAHQIAFVNGLCDLLWSRIGPRRRPHSLVAILTNVSFDVTESKEWDADRVKHCYQSRSRRK